MTNNYDDIRRDCWDKALYSFGSNYVFGQRIRKYEKRNKLLKFSGIVMPLILGGIAGAYGSESVILPILITALAPLGVFQLTISLAAIIWDWDKELSYAYEASQSYNYLSSRFTDMAKRPPPDYTEFEKAHAVLKTEYALREQQDEKHKMSEREERKGMRAGLRQYQKQCAGCSIAPLSMESTNCSVCGNF